MKCWIVGIPDDDGWEWCTLMHADTRGQAIQATRRAITNDDYIEFRARRLSGLDDKPINYQNAKDAGFEYDSDWDYISSEDLFLNDCTCDICKGYFEDYEKKRITQYWSDTEILIAEEAKP